MVNDDDDDDTGHDGHDRRTAEQEIAYALRRLGQDRDELQQDVAELRRVLLKLIDILAGRGHIAEGNRKLLDRLGTRARVADERKVRLATYDDKYQVVNSEVDCAARMHLCHARCCSLSIVLSVQDLEEGKLKWDLVDPYVLRRARDGYCMYLDRATGGCGAYEHRPGTCRAYDCRDDKRIWIDFDAQIPAPMPEGLLPPKPAT